MLLHVGWSERPLSAGPAVVLYKGQSVTLPYDHQSVHDRIAMSEAFHFVKEADCLLIGLTVVFQQICKQLRSRVELELTCDDHGLRR
ncbi:hypothetical protein D3C80_1073000 [compost metagenome]